MGGSPTQPTDARAVSQAPPSPTPRRVETPRWLDVRLIAGAVLVLGSVLVGARIVGDAGDTYGVVASRFDLAAGTTLTGADLTVVRAQLPAHGHGVYLRTVTDALGKRLTRDVSAGELLPAAALSVQGQRTTLTIPLAAAAAPDLRTGDRIEVWLTSAACSSVVLLPDVTVQSVHADTSGAFSTGGGGQDVVISVSADAAGRVATALAIDQAQLRAGVLSGRPVPSAGPAPGPSTSSSPLPDIGSCASASGGR